MIPCHLQESSLSNDSKVQVASCEMLPAAQGYLLRQREQHASMLASCCVPAFSVLSWLCYATQCAQMLSMFIIDIE